MTDTIIEALKDETFHAIWLSFEGLFFVLSSVRGILRFHTENIRFFHSKLLQTAINNLKEQIEKLPNKDEYQKDHQLLVETLIEESFYAIHGIHTSRQEREQILEYVTVKGIPFYIIKKAWLELDRKDGELKPKWEKFNKIEFWTVFIFLIVLWLISVGLALIGIILFISPEFFGEKINPLSIGSLSLFNAFIAFLIYKQNESIFNLRRFHHRLKQTELSESELSR